MTSRAFTAGWLVSAALLSSLAVSSASDQARPAAPPARQALGAAMLPELSVELDEQIGRMTARTAAVTAPAPARRDLFTFAGGAPRRAAAPVPAVNVAAVMEGPVAFTEAPPQPSLAGIADTGAGGLTAVVSLRGRYRVDNVSVDGVDVFDLTLGTILRLSLQL